ncbi:glycosyltransferase family 2 protein [Acetobacter sicerae]|uniref:glycosyltransferase family 2 protein n=1 Tax=Acetobacter sicerae TaxID=85325 RepID=UPI00156B100A|nr:glycosyltransferase family 2 protein [Acetobacter sicerae]NHN92262.1 glycosyltransferase [Acetobacter sicerae]
MKISVALATYNGARYLREQLDSIALQTMQPSELVVSDDGSTDETLQIVREFAQRASFPVRILAKEKNLGFSDNFLFCASHCEGDLIAFCDQDDVWLPEKLKIAHDRIIEDGSLLTIHKQILVDENLRPLGEWDQGITHDEVVQPLTLDLIRGACGNTLMIRSELIHDVPYQDRPQQPEENHKPLAHDTWFFILAAALGTVSRIDKSLILYRQHGNNVYGVSARTWKEKLAHRIHINMTRIKERRDFYLSFTKIFSNLAEKDSPLKKQADLAEKVYLNRMIPLSMMIRIYEAKGIQNRLDAFKRLHFPRKYTKNIDPSLIVNGHTCEELILDDGQKIYREITPAMQQAMRRGSMTAIIKDAIFGVICG